MNNKKNKMMKRLTILLTVLMISHISYSCFKEKNIPPVYSEIPDANFKAYLKKIVPLAFTSDNKFISNHPSVVSYNRRMSIINKKIASLSGIEYFTSLKELDCRDNKLTTLDVSKNISLTDLNCGFNQLTTLDLSNNTKLTLLQCYNNQLSTLDVNSNTNLELLNCERNKLTTLNLGKNEVLNTCYCTENQLTVLDASKNEALTGLYCYSNPLTTLVINPNTLDRLYIDPSIKCCHPSIKAFKDRGGLLLSPFTQVIPPFTCS